ncbi:MAG TPA: DMT family transporter [Candidatus Limnocylindrales bacterium]|nr:DMT family transporter [Candidatus Limnocylindrales bacterium]
MPSSASRAPVGSSTASGRRSTAEGGADLVLLGAISIWSLNFTVMKVGIAEISPVAFPVFRFGIGALVMAYVVRRREGGLGFQRRDALLFLVTAVLGITLNQLCVVYALKLTTAANVALLSATQPIFTAVIATIVGDELLGRRHWLSVGLGLAGVALVVEGGATGQTVGEPGPGGLPLGELLALGVSLTAAASAVTIRRLLGRYSPYRILALQMIIGTAFLLPVAAPSLASEDYATVSPVGWGALAYSAVLAGIVTNLLYFTGIGRVGASRAAVYQYLQSFLGVLLAVLLLREPLATLQVVGGLVVVASVVLSRQDPRDLARRLAARRSARTGRKT